MADQGPGLLVEPKREGAMEIGNKAEEGRSAFRWSFMLQQETQLGQPKARHFSAYTLDDPEDRSLSV